MLALLIILAAIACLVVGYVTYGSWLAKQWGIDPSRKTPAIEKEDGLVIRGYGALRGGKADSVHDHRIAMSAAVAAAICREAVEISDPGCVEKSYPAFWQDLEALETEG